MAKTQQRDPLAPLEFVLAFATALVGLLLVIFTVLIALGHGELNADVCVSIHQGSAATVSDHVDYPRPAAERANVDDRVLPPGTLVRPETLQVCAKHPSFAQRTAAGLTWLMKLLVFAVPVGLGWRLVRLARRQGVFSAPVARWLTILGWWVLLAPIVFSAVVLVTANLLLDSLLPEGGGQPVPLPVSWGTLLTGFGVLTLGRVMARGVLMQEELDTTV